MKPQVLHRLSAQARWKHDLNLLEEHYMAESDLDPRFDAPIGRWRYWITRVFRPHPRECLCQDSGLSDLVLGFGKWHV